MNLLRTKQGYTAGLYFNRMRLCPSLYTAPAYSLRWLWVTVYVDLNRVTK